MKTDITITGPNNAGGTASRTLSVRTPEPMIALRLRGVFKALQRSGVKWSCTRNTATVSILIREPVDTDDNLRRVARFADVVRESFERDVL